MDAEEAAGAGVAVGLADTAMMDPTMDDLFGDGLNVALPPAPLPAATMLRVGEMQRRGCCTKLAWSSTGSIAQIDRDAARLCFRDFVRDTKTATWTLSRASSFPIDAPPGRHFVHVHFSGTGVDLAVVDDVGTVYLYTLTGALGKMLPASGDAAAGVSTARNEMDAVVGLHWLPMYPTGVKGPYVQPASKNDDKWDFPIKQRDQSARAHHPAESRNALLHVNRLGELSLLYQNDGWQSTRTALEPVTSSDELISHADMTEDGPDLLLVTHDSSSRLRLYRIKINWNASQHSRGAKMIQTLVTPSLEVHHLTTLDNARAEHADTAKLTHLRLIPTAPEAAQSLPALPTVLAVFTHIVLPSESSQSHGSFSVAARWQVETVISTLHESFKKMRSAAEVANSPNTLTLMTRQADVVMDKVVLTFESQMFDTIFAFGASDGSIDFRDRMTMDVLQSFGDASQVSSLSQTGFDHSPGAHNIHLAMSNDGSAVVLVRHDGEAHAQPMTFTRGWERLGHDLSDNTPYMSAAEACIARQFAFLCYTNASNDESLALLPIDASLEVRSQVVKNIFRVMNRTPHVAMTDAARQQMIVLKDPMVPRAVSAQVALGTNPISGERDTAAQFAFALLSLRGVATSLAQTVMRPDIKALPVDIFTPLCGLVRWVTDFYIYVIHTISSVKRDMEPGTSVKVAFERLVSNTSNPVVRVLLCSFTRVLLRFTANYTGKLLLFVQQNLLPRVQTIAARQELNALVDLASKMPFTYGEFEKMMVEFDQAVRDTWTSSGVSVEQRGEIETSIICFSSIPSELEPALDTLFATILPKLMENTDMSKLFFWHIDWLGITNSKPSPDGKRQYDVIRKKFIAPGAPLRLCRRCGSVMEDLPPEKVREMPQWQAHVQRHCICMNFWILP